MVVDGVVFCSAMSYGSDGVVGGAVVVDVCVGGAVPNYK